MEHGVRLRLYYDSTEEPLDIPANYGVANGFALLEQARKRGIDCEWVDTSKLSEADRMRAYFDAVGPSVRKKYRIRQVFGSRRNSGWLFGKGVPALVVVDSAKQHPEDVYPRKEVGQMVTIHDFLEILVDGMSEAML